MSAHYAKVLFLYVKWVRDVEAGGSNPLTPTKSTLQNKKAPQVGAFLFAALLLADE